MARGDPRLVLYGPDEKHGATRKATFKSYRWFIRHKGRDIATGYDLLEKQQADDFLADYLKGQHVKRDPRCVAEVVKAYTDTVQRQNSWVTITSQAANIIEAMGDRRADTLTETDGIKYADNRRASGASDNTIRGELRVLNTALKRALKGAAPKMPRPPQPGTAGRAASRDQIAALLRECKHSYAEYGPDLRLFIVLTLYTCQRYNAVLSLGWSPHSKGGHIDLDAGVIDFNAHRAAITTKARGTMPIPGKLLAVLRARKRKANSLYVFPNRSGGVKVSNIRAFKSARERAGIPWLRRHDLLHTGISWRAKITPIGTLSRLINKSPKTLTAYYVHVFDAEILAAANARLR